MIEAVIYTTTRPDKTAVPCGFKVTRHGKDIVCAAVSVLCINTVNSLEVLTSSPLEYCSSPDGGYLECFLPGIIEGNGDPEAVLLLNALGLGLETVCTQYGSGKHGVAISAKEVVRGAALSPKKDYIVFKR